MFFFFFIKSHKYNFIVAQDIFYCKLDHVKILMPYSFLGNASISLYIYIYIYESLYSLKTCQIFDLV